MKTWIVGLLLCISSASFAGLLFNYSNLATKDLDQMSKIVQDKIKESQKSRGDKVVPLKEALQAIYSRPNDDDMLEKLVSPLKNSLDEHDAWESSLKKLTTEAIGALRNPKAFQPVVQVTYAVFLENVLSEMKPRVQMDFEKKLITTIRDAKIQVSKEAKNERVLRVMRETRSPSDIADEILKEAAARPSPTPAPPIETVTPAFENATAPTPEVTPEKK